METCAELQADELEVLDSMYGPDGSLLDVTETSFRVLIDAGDGLVCTLGVEFSDSYPHEPPILSLPSAKEGDSDLSAGAQSDALEFTKELAVQNVGSPMIFTLVEALRGELPALVQKFKEVNMEDESKTMAAEVIENTGAGPPVEVPPERGTLSKVQKRKIANQQRERGWNWVDIRKHLGRS